MKHETDKTSRRGVLPGAMAVIATVGAAGAAAAATGGQRYAQEKLAQNIVQYQQTPKDGARCEMCVNWVAPNSCKIVAGTINPHGWCIAFAPKSG